MKNTISLVLVSSLIILASSAFSDERPHQGMGGMGQSSGMMMQGGGMGQSSGMMMQGGGNVIIGKMLSLCNQTLQSIHFLPGLMA